MADRRIADWICHRVTNIERTTGAKERLTHLLMLTEVSIPVLAGFYLQELVRTLAANNGGLVPAKDRAPAG